jgi:hypothetical protein
MDRFPLFYSVKFLPVIQTFVYSALIFSASAQNENWDTYMAKFGDKPGSVLVDMALINNAPDTRYPYLVITGPKGHDCNKQGLPGKEEINAMEEVLDATDNFITGITAKILTGTFTFSKDADRDTFTSFAVSKKYKTEKLQPANTSGMQYPLTLFARSYIKTSIIDSMTAELKNEAKKCHGTYAGWEAK